MENSGNQFTPKPNLAQGETRDAVAKIAGVGLFRTAETADTLVMGLFSGQRSPFRASDNSGNSFRASDMSDTLVMVLFSGISGTVNPPVLSYLLGA